MRNLLLCALLIGGCSDNAPPPSSAPAAETESPKDSPMHFKVLADDSDKQANTVDYHVLIAANPKHDDVDGLLKYLYRHLMTRREPQPSGISASVYSDEVQF